MTDEEFRKLYCRLVEWVKPSAEVMERILKNVLAALEKNRNRQEQKRLEKVKDPTKIAQKSHPHHIQDKDENLKSKKNS